MKVSIIIPIYKVADFIGDCLDSVIKQDYHNIEVVLVDDATPDNSMEVAEPYITKLHEKFEVIIVKHEKNRGLSAARNSGVSASTGDWLYFLDSDDEISQNCIGLLVAKAKQYPDSDFVIGEVKIVGSNMIFPLHIKEYQDKSELVESFLQANWYVMAVNKLLNKSLFIENDLWFEEGLLHEDELFSFKLAFAAQSMSAVFEETYIYKVRLTGSITADKTFRNYACLIQINNYRLEYLKNVATQFTSLVGYASINYTYCFILDISSNDTLSRTEKKEIIATTLLSFRNVASHLINLTNTSKIKKHVLTAPYMVAKLFIHTHYLILKIKECIKK